MFRRVLNIGMLLLTGILLSACKEQKTGGSNIETYHSEVYKTVEANILEMASKKWDKSVYKEIRDEQIPLLDKVSERTSATTLLEAEYVKLMIKEARGILDSGCGGNNHNKLDRLMSEIRTISGYKEAPGYSDLLSLKQLHDRVKDFAWGSMPSQNIANYRTAYDSGYESDKKAKAKEYLENSKLKCASTRARLEALTGSSPYAERRLRYCASILDSYLESDRPEVSELNAVKANLQIYNSYQSDSVSRWKAVAQQHYEELNKNNTGNEAF